MNNSNLPTYIDMGSAYDERGFIEYFNDFYKFKAQRFYIINNNQDNFIRAWHGHKKEAKIFYSLSGFIQISAVKIKNFKNPDKNTEINNFFLSSRGNKLLYIPGGFANGIKFFNSKDRLLVFSSSTLKESLKDDYRYNYDYWSPWDSKFR